MSTPEESVNFDSSRVRRSVRFVFSYLFLVVMPIAVLFCVLRMGKTLIAPRAVDGVWKIEVDGKDLEHEICFSWLRNHEYFTISQSGNHLKYETRNSALIHGHGTLNVETLRILIGIPARQTSGSCTAESSFELVAVIKQTSTRELWGTLGLAGCGSCPVLPFHATQQGA